MVTEAVALEQGNDQTSFSSTLLRIKRCAFSFSQNWVRIIGKKIQHTLFGSKTIKYCQIKQNKPKTTQNNIRQLNEYEATLQITNLRSKIKIEVMKYTTSLALICNILLVLTFMFCFTLPQICFSCQVFLYKHMRLSYLRIVNTPKPIRLKCRW